MEVSNATPAEAEQRLEKLARAYEDGKPSFVAVALARPLQPVGQEEKDYVDSSVTVTARIDGSGH